MQLSRTERSQPEQGDMKVFATRSLSYVVPKTIDVCQSRLLSRCHQFLLRTNAYGIIYHAIWHRTTLVPAGKALLWPDLGVGAWRPTSEAKDERREWHTSSGYSQRSMAEHTVFRYKTIIGRSMRSRTFDGQRVEVQLASKILNTMTLLGMPDSYRVA